jgi:hypothetical protein
MVEPRGIEPRSVESANRAQSTKNSAKVLQFSALRWKASSSDSQNCALLMHNQRTSAHPKSVPSVSTDSDLAEVIAGWDQLSGETKARILKTVRASRSRLYGLWVTDAADAILLQPGQSLIAHDFVFTSSVWNGGSTEPLVAGTFETFYKEENTEQNMTCRAKYGATEKLMLFTIRFDRGQIVLKQRGFRGRSWRFN